MTAEIDKFFRMRSSFPPKSQRAKRERDREYRSKHQAKDEMPRTRSTRPKKRTLYKKKL